MIAVLQKHICEQSEGDQGDQETAWGSYGG